MATILGLALPIMAVAIVYLVMRGCPNCQKRDYTTGETVQLAFDSLVKKNDHLTADINACNADRIRLQEAVDVARESRDQAQDRAVEHVQSKIAALRTASSRVAQLTAECERRSTETGVLSQQVETLQEERDTLQIQLNSAKQLWFDYRELWRAATGQSNGISVEELVQREVVNHAVTAPYPLFQRGNGGATFDEPITCTGPRLLSAGK